MPASDDNTQTSQPPQEADLKRLLVLQQATEVFAAEGFRHADVQMIADRAGVGKGTVYRYFGNKEDLFWAACTWILSQLQRQLVAAMKGIDSPLQKLRATGLAYARFFEENPKYLEVFVQDRAEFRGTVPQTQLEYHERMISEYSEIVRLGIEQGEIKPVERRKTILSLANMLFGTVVLGCYHGKDYTLTEMTEYALDNFLQGVRAEPPTRQQESNA